MDGAHDEMTLLIKTSGYALVALLASHDQSQGMQELATSSHALAVFIWVPSQKIAFQCVSAFQFVESLSKFSGWNNRGIPISRIKRKSRVTRTQPASSTCDSDD